MFIVDVIIVKFVFSEEAFVLSINVLIAFKDKGNLLLPVKQGE